MRLFQKKNEAAVRSQLRSGQRHPFTALDGYTPLGGGEVRANVSQLSGDAGDKKSAGDGLAQSSGKRHKRKAASKARWHRET